MVWEGEQALTATPRGGVIPHLLTTPRREHLYEPGPEVCHPVSLAALPSVTHIEPAGSKRIPHFLL